MYEHVDTPTENTLRAEFAAWQLRHPDIEPIGAADTPECLIKTESRVIKSEGRDRAIGKWLDNHRRRHPDQLAPWWPQGTRAACQIATLLRAEDQDGAVPLPAIRATAGLLLGSMTRAGAKRYGNGAPELERMAVTTVKYQNDWGWWPVFITQPQLIDMLGVTRGALYLMFNELEDAGASVSGVVRFSDLAWLTARAMLVEAKAWMPPNLPYEPALVWAAVEARRLRGVVRGRPQAMTRREFKQGVEAIQRMPAATRKADGPLWVGALPTTSDMYRPLTFPSTR